jgi:hypothetical protein
MQIETESRKALVKLVAKSYDILQVLYPNEKLSVTDIATKLDDSAANVSRTIGLLEKEALIRAAEARDERKGGRPKKICSLTNKAQQIVGVFEQPLKPGLADPQISILIALMEDKTLSPKTREVAVGTLCDHAASISESLLGNQKVRPMFKQAVNSYSNEEEEMEKSTRSILSASLPYIFENQEKDEWFYRTFFDDFLRISKDPSAPKPLREYAIDTLSRTARLSNHPATISRTIDALVSLYFQNQDSSDTVRNELFKFGTKLQLQTIEKIRQHANNEDQKQPPRIYCNCSSRFGGAKTSHELPQAFIMRGLISNLLEWHETCSSCILSEYSVNAYSTLVLR